MDQIQRKVIFAIPARFASTRLPGKPLLSIKGKSMICRVLENVTECAAKLNAHFGTGKIITKIVVATDDERIESEVTTCNHLAVMTDSKLTSGTDRIFAAICKQHQEWLLDENDYVVNIQGDEPFFSCEDVVKLIVAMIEAEETQLGTLVFEQKMGEKFFKSSVVKVVTNERNRAVYFSRAPIPWDRKLLGASGTDWTDKIKCLENEANVPGASFLHHVGIYVYKWLALEEFALFLNPGRLEKLEGLEQLRALEAGWDIMVLPTSKEPMGIDTEEDLKAAENFVEKT